MRSSVLITYKFLKNLIRQQKLSGHPKQFMITFDLIIEDRHFQVEIETISVCISEKKLLTGVFSPV